MHDSDVHLGSSFWINVSLIYFFQNIQPFLNFAEHRMFSIEWAKVGFGKRDEKLTII